VLVKLLPIAPSSIHIETKVGKTVPTQEPRYEEVDEEYVEEIPKDPNDFVINLETAQGKPRCIASILQVHYCVIALGYMSWMKPTYIYIYLMSPSNRIHVASMLRTLGKHG